MHNNQTTEQIIIFTRYPEPGLTKTRLIPELGPEKAADLQRRMTEHTMSQVAGLMTAAGPAVEIRYQDGSPAEMADWLGPGYSYQSQGHGSLGEKMNRAFLENFAKGRQAVLIIGADCPALSRQTIEKTLAGLKENDLVLGPAFDGGYYLIGLRKKAPSLFTDIPWGTGTVLAATLERAEQGGLSHLLLEQLNDIDRPEDLNALPKLFFEDCFIES